VDYIHFNPVKHGWAKQVIDWPHSSFHHYVQQGILPNNWVCSIDNGKFGETSSTDEA
jgi:putative transposase